MHGLMMDCPLLISQLITHADRHHGDSEIVSSQNGEIHRYTYRDAHKRSQKLANALKTLGAKPGDRIATLAWNGHRHFEIYYAVSGSQMIVHTVNPRLYAEQIAWILNHSEAQVLFFDPHLWSLVESILPTCSALRHLVVMGDASKLPDVTNPHVISYEDLIARESDEFEWPQFDERTASGLCYTSGTTGNPKGALYSHRSTVLHAYSIALPDSMNLSRFDSVLPVVPMFHVNAWGIPYAAALTGMKLVLPGAALDGKSLYDLMEQESVTFSAGVPTVWLGLLDYMTKNNKRLTTLKRLVIGGAACPNSMLDALEDEHGIKVHHSWGMTEMSPVGAICNLKKKHLELPPEERRKVLRKQGGVIASVDWKIIDAEGNELAWDGTTGGDLLVRGPAIISQYFKSETELLIDGWLPTGDVATIDPDGYMQITDRSKDVIKSGGEWISSLELENIAMSHPCVHEAAAIACDDEKWGERPLLIVVKKANATVSRDELLKFYEDKIAKWCIPDDVIFVDELPHTATGKLQKLKLREQYRNHRYA